MHTLLKRPTELAILYFITNLYGVRDEWRLGEQENKNIKKNQQQINALKVIILSEDHSKVITHIVDIIAHQ